MESREASNGGGVYVKLRRIISFTTLAISILPLVLVLKRPAPCPPISGPAAAAANAQSFQEKVNQLAQPRVPGDGESEVRINSGELSAGLMQAAGLALPGAPANASAGAPSTGTSNAFPGAVPNIKDYQVSLDGDLVRAQFLPQSSSNDASL